ncbi:unnamed protein product [Choristocarpus tenellus]
MLTVWFLEHKEWPYPDQEQKLRLAKATGLSSLQM